MWVFLGVISSVFLGVYDILKKSSLQNNAVIPVLFFSTVTSSLIFAPFITLSILDPVTANALGVHIPTYDITAHLHFFLKSVIVGSSWVLAYYSLRHLPITIVVPIRASGPIWTLIGAIILFGELLTPMQWAGLGITFFFYYLFSLVGKKEGIRFAKNKWVFFIFLATIIGTISALYDKFLTAHYDRLSIQGFFSLYMVLVLFPVYRFFWYPKRRQDPFTWKFTIPLIGIVLVMADFAYFYSLSYQDSLISILSILRRSSVVYSFVIGAFIFKERNKKQKGYILLGILAGIALIIFGST